MGRIKTTAMKRLANDVLAKNAKAFSTDFGTNKEALQSVIPIESKKIRNMVTGYITQEMKRRAKAG
jgi:ribosomal protein S17E